MFSWGRAGFSGRRARVSYVSSRSSAYGRQDTTKASDFAKLWTDLATATHRLITQLETYAVELSIYNLTARTTHSRAWL